VSTSWSEVKILGIANLCNANALQASLFADNRYKKALQHTKAGVVFTSASHASLSPVPTLIAEDPVSAFEKAAKYFQQAVPKKTIAIHPTALIHPSCTIGKNVYIGPFCTLEEGVVIGDFTTIDAYTFIGSYCKIGNNCKLMPRTTIQELSILEDNVFIESGTVIGALGFGFKTDEKGHHNRLDHLGIVVIESDVEIGGNTVIDRARFTETRIKRGTKIDKLVSIGHNVTLGEDNIFVSQAGIAGSSRTGNHVVLAGQAGICDHVEIADKVMIAAKSGVTKSLTSPGIYNGIPAKPVQEYNRTQIFITQIEKLKERIKVLEERLSAL
jgi:UDP-3-O-[3-hydroxymyristoyl] glucosamine N-acyltransferase